MPEIIIVQPKSNTVKFYEAQPVNPVPELAVSSYEQTNQIWQFPIPYVQKVEFTDDIVLQFGVYNSSSAPIFFYICDSNKNIITTIGGSGGNFYDIYPVYKGYLDIGVYVDPVSGTPYGLRVYMFSFKFGDFSAYLPEGVYYIQIAFQATPGFNGGVYFSEPMQVLLDHPFTELIQFSYNSNNSEKNIVQTGWYYDSLHTSPYNPVWAIRAEMYKVYAEPRAINIGYLQSNYEQLQNKTMQRPFWKLAVGENCLGIPFPLLETLTEAVLADNFWFAGYPYIVDNPDSKSTLAGVWKVKTMDTIQLCKAECSITERYDAQRALTNTGFVPMWSDPISGFPYATGGATITDGINVYTFPIAIFYTESDSDTYLSNLNSYYLDLYFLQGIFLHEGGNWYYQNGDNESFYSDSDPLVLTHYFTVVKQIITPFPAGFNFESHISNNEIIDWGDGSPLDTFEAYDGIYHWVTHSYANFGTYTVNVFHDDRLQGIEMGQHFSYPESNISISGELPTSLTQLTIWLNNFTTTTPEIDLSRCAESLVDLVITQCGLTGFANTIFNTPFPNLLLISFNNNALTQGEVDKLFNTFYHGSEPTIATMGTFLTDGGTNAAPSFASGLSRTALANIPYDWGIITN